MLWPTEQVCRDEKLNDNDKSAVLLIEYAGRKILLCSDIEKFAQKEFLRFNPNLKADVVVAPHHGLAETLEPDFLEKLEADIVICSCDQSQYERINATTAFRTGNVNKTRSFYTATDGAITISINKYGMIETDVFVK